MAKKREDRSAAHGAGESPLHRLLAAGRTSEARAEARRVLADASASDADREAARDLLRRTGYEPMALAVGLIALAVVAAVAALLLLR